MVHNIAVPKNDEKNEIIHKLKCLACFCVSSLKAVDKGVNYEQNGVSAILADNTVPVRLFGQHFTNQTIVRFVRDVRSRGADCEETDATEAYAVIKTNK